MSISVDELTIGFSLGLLGLALAVTIAWIAMQAFVAAQLGLWLGSRLSDAARKELRRFWDRRHAGKDPESTGIIR